MKFTPYLIAAVLLVVAPHAAAPQSKGVDKAAAEKAKKEARIRAAILEHGGYNFGDGIYVSVSGSHIAIQVPRNRVAEMCNDGTAPWAYLRAEDIALIVDTYMQAARKSQEERAKGLEHLARTIGAYRTPESEGLPSWPAADGNAKSLMSPIPNKALAARKGQ